MSKCRMPFGHHALSCVVTVLTVVMSKCPKSLCHHGYYLNVILLILSFCLYCHFPCISLYYHYAHIVIWLILFVILLTLLVILLILFVILLTAIMSLLVGLNVLLQCCNAQWHYAECCYRECHYAGRH
jgi:hypothetical protein